MFKFQQAIADATPQLYQLWQTYSLPLESLNDVIEKNTKFMMRVPLIGSFSAGKSTILNSLLNDKMLAVDIDPVSNLPVEFSYAEQENIVGHYANGQTLPLSREQLKTQSFGSLLPDGWIQVDSTADILKSLKHLRLVDLPGLDSKNTQHEQAINSYLHRSLAYCLVISSEAGTLPESTRHFLSELKIYRMPVLVVISKADKKTPSDLSAVVDQVKQQVQSLLGSTTEFDIVTTYRKDTSALVPALEKLEFFSEQCFTDTVGLQMLNLLKQLEKTLNNLLNSDDLDIEQIKVKLEQHQQEMNTFKKILQHEDACLDQGVFPTVDVIVARTENQLTSHLESLAISISAGVDVSGHVSQIVRAAIIQGLYQDFAELVKKYEHHISDALPQDVYVSNNFQFKPDIQFDFSTIMSGVMYLLKQLLKRFPIVAVIAPIVEKLLGSFLSKQQEEAENEQRREKAKQYILNILMPQIMTQVRSMVLECIQTQVVQVKAKMLTQTEQQNQIYQATLKQLQADIQKSESSLQQAKSQYQQDLIVVQQLIQQWQNL